VDLVNGADRFRLAWQRLPHRRQHHVWQRLTLTHTARHVEGHDGVGIGDRNVVTDLDEEKRFLSWNQRFLKEDIDVAIGTSDEKGVGTGLKEVMDCTCVIRQVCMIAPPTSAGPMKR